MSSDYIAIGVLLLIRMAVALQQVEPFGLSKSAPVFVQSLQVDSIGMYYGQVKIGGQPFNMIFDTGTADSWVFSSKYKNLNSRRGYSVEESSTSTLDGRRFYSMYGNEIEVAGHLIVDDITLGYPQVTIRNQTLGVITTMTNEILADEFLFDGVIGLAFGSLSYRNLDTVFENMVKQNLVPDKVFSIYLNKELPPNGKAAGEILFGGIDASRYLGQLNYVPLVLPQHWRFQIDGLAIVSDKNENKLDRDPIHATLDTGTSLFGHDAQPSRLLVSQAFSSWIDHSDPLEFVPRLKSCNRDPLPQLVFTIGGINYTIRSDSFVLEVPNEDSVEGGGPDCYLGFRHFPYNEGFARRYPIWILGNAFMRNYYAVFDFGQQRVGLAQANS